MKVNFVCRVKFILSNCLCFGFYFFVFFVRFFLRLCGLTSELGKRPHSRRLVVFSLSPFVNPNEGRSHLVRKSIRSEALYLLSCCGGMRMALWAKNVHLSFFTIDSVRKEGWIEFQGRTLRKLVLKWSTTDKSWNRSKYNPHLQLLKSKLAVVRLALE